jgi:hypothetical protein
MLQRFLVKRRRGPYRAPATANGNDVRICAAITALTGALALAGCGGAPPAAGYSKQEFVVARPAATVYRTLQDRMTNCRATNSLFARADIDGAFDAAAGHGRLAVMRGGKALWGAELLAEDGGTRVLAFAARDVEDDHYEWLIRQWATETYKRTPFPDC